MITSQISINHTFNFKRVSYSADSSQHELNTREGINPSGNDQTEQMAVNQTRSDFTKIQVKNATFNSIAMNIQAADKAMEDIEKRIEKMQEELETHVKNYPPFLPGSEERVKLLKSFQAFRKQIDKMTIPPEYEYAMKIMADPSVNQEAGDWTIEFGENGPHITIRNKEVHTGPTGLDIPELPEGATDEIIETAIFRIGNAKDTLKRARASLSRDLSDLAHLKETAPQVKDMPEYSAESMSVEIKHILARESDKSLTQELSRQLTNLLI